MLALWSRTFQAQSSSCRCRICHSANVLTRRTTTAAPAHKFTVADAFTACYTTILGTAAIIDANRKDVRRRELDHQLELARCALQDVQNSPPPGRVDNIENTESTEPYTTNNIDRNASPNVLFPAPHRQEPIAPILTELEALCRHHQRPLITNSWTWGHPDWISIQSAVAFEEKNPDITLREPKNEDHLQRTTGTITYLVDRLIQEIELSEEQREANKKAEQYLASKARREQKDRKYKSIYGANEASRTKESAAVIRALKEAKRVRWAKRAARIAAQKDKIIARTGAVRPIQPHLEDGDLPPELLTRVKGMREFESAIYPSYQSPHDDPERTAYVRDALNESIRRIFNKQQDMRTKVASICYNMLVVSVPPTIHTFNTLIAGFNGLGRPDLAQIVVDSYLNMTTWPATAQTIVCLLKHYQTPDGLEGLRYVVQRMRGARGDGMHHAIFRKADPSHPVHPDFMTWTSKYCGLQQRAFVQRTHITDAVYNSLIQAWVYHKKVANACLTFVACLRHGALISAETLHALLQCCMAVVDAQALRRLMYGINKHFANFEYLLNTATQDIPASAGRQLMQDLYNVWYICSLHMGSARMNYILLHTDTLEQLFHVYKTTDTVLQIREAIELSARVVNTFDTDDALPSLPLPSQVRGALHAMYTARGRRIAAARFHKSFSSASRIYYCVNRFNVLERTTRNLIAAVTSMTILDRTGFDCDPQSLLLTDQRALKPWQRLSPHYAGRFMRVLRHALGHISVLRAALTLTTVGDAKEQLMMRIPDEYLKMQLEASRGWGEADDVASEGLKTLLHMCYPTAFQRPWERPGEIRLGLPIELLEREVQEVEDATRAILFASIKKALVKRDILAGPGYYKVGIGHLAAIHHQTFRVQRAWFQGHDDSDSPDDADLSEDRESPMLSAVDRWADSFGSDVTREQQRVTAAISPPPQVIQNKSSPIQEAALG